MKIKLNIVIAFAALVILIVTQVYIVVELYNLKEQQFVRNYGDEVFLGIELLQQQEQLNAMAPAFEVLNEAASQIIFDNPPFTLSEDSVKNRILSQFREVINESDSISPFVKAYLESKGLDTGYSSIFIIRNINIKDFASTYPIYNDTVIGGDSSGPYLKPGAIYIRSFRAVYDYFDAEIDLYVDFSNKITIILREMSSVLILLALTLTVVILVYIRTLRNMLKQKKLSELKSDFISNMTHELKTPLSTIAVASSSLTLDEVLADRDKSKKLSEIIKRQNRLLNQMIDQVLDISALERSGFSLNKEPVKVGFLFDEIVEAFRVNQAKKNVTVNMKNLPDGDLVVYLDKFQITRVLNNLFSNAVKYNDKEPQINVELTVNGAVLKITISDNGIGISKEEKEEVFTKFYRGEHNLSRKIRGLGLGLYFVKRIVDAHGGTISLESTIGEGSTFTIDLPLKRMENESTVS